MPDVGELKLQLGGKVASRLGDAPLPSRRLGVLPVPLGDPRLSMRWRATARRAGADHGTSGSTTVLAPDRPVWMPIALIGIRGSACTECHFCVRSAQSTAPRSPR